MFANVSGELEKATEEEKQAFENYIGEGVAHLPSPNAATQEKMETNEEPSQLLPESEEGSSGFVSMQVDIEETNINAENQNLNEQTCEKCPELEENKIVEHNNCSTESPNNDDEKYFTPPENNKATLQCLSDSNLDLEKESFEVTKKKAKTDFSDSESVVMSSQKNNDQLAKNELNEFLKKVPIDKNCFSPDFFNLLIFKKPTETFVYTHIPGYNDSENLVDENFPYENLPGYLYQPWHLSFDEKTCEMKKSKEMLRFEQATNIYLNIWEDSHLMFETMIHDINGVPIVERRPFVAFRKYFELEKTDGRMEQKLNVLKFIVELARKANKVLPKNIVQLTTGKHRSVTMSQYQCAVIVANMFIGMNRKYLTFQKIMKSSSKLAVEKLKFMMNYFETIQKKMPEGIISFRRKEISRRSCDFFENVKKKIPNDVHITSELKIEEAVGCSQMDFANEYIGGGVLSEGAVQEEIRFLMCPEMMVSMVLCPKMRHQEAIFIVGAQTYSSYKGYGSSLKWCELSEVDAKSNIPIDRYGRINTELVAIDAIPYSFRGGSREQFCSFQIEREMNKLCAGFSSQYKSKIPIVTGWWGCGAFGGNKQLKALLQLTVAGLMERPMIFCTFNEEDLAEKFRNLVKELKCNNLDVGWLFHRLLSYNRYRRTEIDVFDFILFCINNPDFSLKV